MFAYIAGSPFVFIKLYGVPAEHYGWLFGTNAAGFILVAQVNARLLSKRGPAFLLTRTVWVYLAAALALLAVSALHTEALWPLLVPLFLCIASLGCIMPNTSACAMNGQGARAGSASALLGCIQFGVAAGAASLVGALHDGTAMPMSIVISLCGVLAVVVAMWTHALLVFGKPVGRLDPVLQGVGEGAGLGFTAEGKGVLVQADLPFVALGF
eukprot:gene7487-9538_t